MFKFIKRFIEINKLMETPAFKTSLEAAKLQEEKMRDYNTLVRSPFKYEIIKDFINAAQHGVVVRFTIDGIPMEIRKEEQPKHDRGPNALF